MSRESSASVSRKPIVVDDIEMTCEACPSQWEGRTRDGRFVYVRYRWGGLQVGFGATLDDAIADETIYREIGDDMHGVLSYDELRAATQDDGIVWPVK